MGNTYLLTSGRPNFEKPSFYLWKATSNVDAKKTWWDFGYFFSVDEALFKTTRTTEKFGKYSTLTVYTALVRMVYKQFMLIVK